MSASGSHPAAAPLAGGPTVLLDSGDTKHRLVQQFVPLAGVFLLLTGTALLVRGDGSARLLAGACIVLGVGLIALVTRVLVRFDVPYKGHAIRFENSAVRGESLSIDGERASGGVFGYRKTIRSTIRSGEGAGEQIAATSEAGLLEFRCRIVAEPPGEGRKPDGVSKGSVW